MDLLSSEYISDVGSGIGQSHLIRTLGVGSVLQGLLLTAEEMICGGRCSATDAFDTVLINIWWKDLELEIFGGKKKKLRK